MYFVREKDLVKRLSRSKSSIWRDVEANMLPPPVKMGPRNLVWPEEEITIVMAAYIAGKAPGEIQKIVTNLVKQRGRAFDNALDAFELRRLQEADGD